MACRATQRNRSLGRLIERLDIDMLKAGLLEGVPHGFSTREGLASGDVLSGAKLAMLTQTHSPDALVVDEAWDFDVKPQGDALVTALSGTVLGIVTADCAPILLADRKAGVIGAAHAGWRGAASGVIANTVAAMEGLGADPARICAAIGPTIAQASYEVDEGMRGQFAPQYMRFFSEGTRAGHYQFDLPCFVAALLKEAGVAAIEDCKADTYTALSAGANRGGGFKFFSYRRATHLSQETGGRQVSLIGNKA